MANQVIRFQLVLGYEQVQSIYQGLAHAINVIAEDGRRIQFPARHLHRFITHSGIHGCFEITLTETNQFVAIRRLSIN